MILYRLGDMHLRCRIEMLLAGALTLAAPTALAAQSGWAVHLFGTSYHYRSRTYRTASGALRRYEQLNFGVGIEYVIHDGDRTLLSADAGLYRDSKDRGNGFAGPACRFKLGSHVLAGAGVIVLTSRTYAVPVAPLPLLTVRWRRADLNTTWIPALSSRASGAFAWFATVHV